MTKLSTTYSFTPRRTLLSMAVGLALAVAHAPAMAQTDQAATAEDVTIEEITVTGIRSSLDSAALIKRGADQMVDAITAEDIGLFSDNNIGEALQRVPGVQLERDAGEGFRISIRGLGPRFVRTTVNGRTALSAAGGEDGSSEDSRGFTLNMMPSEVITRVTVEKSVQAKNLEGGIGGTVDLQTNRPIDFANRKKEDFYISTALRGGHNDLVGDNAYRGSLFLNKKVNDNFGAYLGVVLDDTDRADHAIESEALRVRDDFRIDRLGRDLDEDPLLNGESWTSDELGDLYDGWEDIGEDGAYPTFMNGARNSMRDFDRDRQTYSTGLQWNSGNFDVNFDYTYGHEKNNQYLRRFAMSPGQVARRDEGYVTSIDIDWADEDFGRTTPTPGFVEAFEFEGARGDERVNTENRQINRDQDIHVGGINVEWSNDDWTIVGDVGYALMEMDRFDNQLGTQWNSDDRNRFNRDPRFERINGSFELVDGYPVAYLEGVCVTEGGCGSVPEGGITPFDSTDPGQFFFRRAWRTLTSEEADDISARLDFSKMIEPRDDGDILSMLDSVMFGVSWNERNGTRTKGRAREDEEGSRGDDYSPISVNDVITPYQTYLVQDYLPDISGAVHEMVFLSHDDPTFATQWAIPKSELLGRYLQHNQGFDVTEEVMAAYIQFPFSGEGFLPYRGNIGLRYVDTEQTGFAYEEKTYLDASGEPVEDHLPRHTERNYDDYLPSFNIAFDVTDDIVVRFAASESLTRPDPLDLTSYVSLGDFEDWDDDIGSGSGGNPDLEPYRSTNIDASFEWYPEFGGSYALGLFHKDLDGWISRGRSEEVFLVAVAVDEDGDEEADYYEMREELYSIRRKVNTDGGTIKGAEAAFHMPFDSFTDGFMGQFGLNGSVTYVDAEIDAVVPENNLPVSLRGTSEWSANLVAYFETEKFSTRVAANYRDDFLFQEAEDPERHAEWTEGSTIIDVNMSYRIRENMLIRASANNITGETRERYWQTAGAPRFSDDRDNGQYYTLEFRYHTR